jgi:hypothetical protein
MTERQIKRPKKLGILDIETARELGRRQADVLRLLEPNAWTRRLRALLRRCSKDTCGHKGCAEVCAFGNWRRRSHLIPAARRLFKNTDVPVFEVTVARGIWARPIGDLRTMNVAAAKQLNRRALDTIFIPGIVAVGAFKVYLARYPEPYWICAIHQIVAGAAKEDLEKAFVGNWAKEQFDSVVTFNEVKNVRQAFDDVFRSDLRGWQHPNWPDGNPINPKKSHREEFYQWLLGMTVGERMVRYGCDRYLNPLKKAPRTIRAKVLKPRPNPVWLIPYQFGNRGQPGEYPNGYGQRRR